MHIRQLKTVTIVIGLFATLLSTNAQLTLEECQRQAEKNYPLIHRYDLIHQTTDFTLSNIGKGWLPQLTVSGQASYQSDVMVLPDMLQNLLKSNGYDYRGLKKDQYKVALDLSQAIYDGGGIEAQKEATRAESEVNRRQTEVDMYALRNRINDLYFGLLLLDDKIRLNEELQQLLSANCDKCEAMLKSGVAMQADVDAIRAELLYAGKQSTELHSTRECFKQILAIFTGQDITDSLVMPQATIPADNDNRRPELLLFDAQISKIKAQDKLLDTAIRPRVSLFAQGWYGYPGMDMFSDMFSHAFTLNGLAGIRLSWNIGALYTRKNDKRKLGVAISQIENARDVFLFNNRLQLAQEATAMEKYRRMISEDSAIVSLRTSIRKAAEAKLKHGTINVNDLLHEITLENQARIQQSVHNTEMLKAIYEIKNTINQ